MKASERLEIIIDEVQTNGIAGKYLSII